MTQENDRDLWGWIYALSAFGWWGVGLPMLLITLNGRAANYAASGFHWSMEILVHRAIWAFVVCVFLVTLKKQWPQVRAVFHSKKALLLLFISTLLILGNWFGFIIGASEGRLSEVSLGYFINPLLNILLGYLFFGERLRRFQIVAVILVILGVAWMIFVLGQVPWIALLLAFSFGFYGLVRKQMKFDSMVCLTIEMAYCLPLAAGYIVYRNFYGPEWVTVEWDLWINLLLFACGPATAAPLIWFGSAARRLRLSTVGMIQFLGPTLQLIVALVANGETMSQQKLIGYVLIWIAVGFYLWDISRKKQENPSE